MIDESRKIYNGGKVAEFGMKSPVTLPDLNTYNQYVATNTEKFKSLAKQFQETILREYGKELTIEQAELTLHDLTEFFMTLSTVYRRIDEDTEG